MSALTLAGAFAAGLTTSFGPCVAPRYLALAAIASSAKGAKRWIRVACFVAGLLACYMLLATTASLLAQTMVLSRFIYLLLAAGFLAFAINTLLVRRTCGHAVHRSSSNGATLLSGGVLGLVLSPCCSPLTAMMAVGTISGSVSGSLVGVFAFATGHLMPLAIVGLGLGTVERVIPSGVLTTASTTVGGGLSLALAAYYGLLA